MLIDKLIGPILNLSRFTKRSIAIAVDASVCVLTVWLAFSLRLEEWIPLSSRGWPAAAASPLIAIPIFAAFGMYRSVFRYVSWTALVAISQAVLVYGVIYSALFTAFSVPSIPRTVGIVQPLLLFLAIGGTRGLTRYFLGGQYRRRLRSSQVKTVLIYGAGSAGRQLASALSETLDTRPVGFIDDDVNLHNSTIGGLRIYDPADIEAVVHKKEISEIFLAIPSASRARRNEILSLIQKIGVAVRTLPGIVDLAHGRVTTSDLRPLEIEDILGRDPVEPNETLMSKNVREKVVLVTGAGGSIGSELSRQILAQRPSCLLLVDSSEFALYTIHRELERISDASQTNTKVIPLIASVLDESRLRRIFEAWHPDTVYHAAAYKHVPLVEHNPVEGVRNNVIGTWVTALVARDCGTSNFVLVSTDKAVRPTNIMGASKRLSEMVLQAMAAETSSLCCSMVRFGNVLDSSGSVVPLFRQQIENGAAVTVTHREITRYFMTIPEAAQLVIQAGALANGGEVFVLDMGEPVRIIDLATRMVELSGLKVRDKNNPDGDIQIEFTGLRPGEKLYEELLIGGNPSSTAHPRVMMAHERFPLIGDLMPGVKLLQDALQRQDAREVKERLAELVPDYAPSEELVDWVTSQEDSDVISFSDYRNKA